jgi:hypothetical protein
VYLVTPRAPSSSALATMPPERQQLILEHNGRRLYVNVPAGQHPGQISR